jgi:hypothetical protein
MFRRCLPLFAVVVMVLGNPTVAVADGPLVRVAQQAILTSPATVTVFVDVNCGSGGPGAEADVFVRLGQGPWGGTGAANTVNDGDWQELAVEIAGGPFTPGDAMVDVHLLCPGFSRITQYDLFGSTIKIATP